MTVPAEKLLEILKDGMLPQAWVALHSAVVQGNRRVALGLIKQEAPFRPAETIRLYDYLVEKLARDG